MLIRLWGESDDCVMVTVGVGEPKPTVEEYPHARSGPWIAHLIAPDGQGLAIHAVFWDLWHVGIGPLPNPADDDRALPLPQDFDWGFGSDNCPNGTATLLVDCPDNTCLIVQTENK